MQALHQPLATPHDLPLKSGRRPLQPKNSLPNPVPAVAKVVKSKAERIQISLPADANKENHPPIHAKAASVESCDLSLADELNAVKRKLERLRLERERTEQMLKERDMILELRMKELLQRSKEQRDLEMEVDRLFRLKELRLYCMRISPIRSLREKEREKIFADAQFPEYEIGDGEESVGENSSLDSSEFVTGF
ncbi:high mobility group B protein 13-like [Cucurbita moschata]|uniref:High mobility group B protein 13-like n=1 Tax=Cucurbita moschata TaxID=3662 RepID=A0A6J1GEZ0_CUCMO|nr:high mobility group B protein 13-like [Cucurbita moschata]